MTVVAPRCGRPRMGLPRRRCAARSHPSCIAFVAVMLAMAGPVATAAQSRTVSVNGPAGNPIRDGTPQFSLAASGFPAAELPLQMRLEVSLSVNFAPPLWADTSVTGSAATIVIPRLLPPNTSVWWRVVATNAAGELFVSNAEGPRQTLPWVSLIHPNNLNGTSLSTLRPTFLWSSVAIHPPVAPWRYTIVISRSLDGIPVVTGTLTDTTYTPFADLESNTSYRWAVSAVAGTGDSVRVINASSFVIASANAPIATVMFQSFPTPFPTDRLQATCIWFDLRRQSAVTLDVLDLRGNRVRRILPGRGLGGTLPPGRYGRVTLGSDNGCDERLTWDGTDESGRSVQPGVYLIRFTGDGVTTVRKVLFRGR